MQLIERIVIATLLLTTRDTSAHYIQIPYVNNGQFTPLAWPGGHSDSGVSRETLEDSAESVITYLHTQPHLVYTAGHPLVHHYVPQVIVHPYKPVYHIPKPVPQDSPENSEEQLPLPTPTLGIKGHPHQQGGIKGSAWTKGNTGGAATTNINGPHHDGSYDFTYKTDDQSRNEVKDAEGNVEGSWKYKGAGGHQVEVSFKADHGQLEGEEGIKGGHPVKGLGHYPWGHQHGKEAGGTTSYKYSFKTDTFSKTEMTDERGNVEGHYTYMDGTGKERKVTYTARAGEGFRPQGDIYPDAGGAPNTIYDTSLQKPWNAAHVPEDNDDCQQVTQVHQQEDTQVHQQEDTQVHQQEDTQVHQQEDTQVHQKEEDTQVHQQEDTQVHQKEEDTQVHQQEDTQVHQQEDTQVHQQEDTQVHQQEDTQVHQQEDTQVHQQEDTQVHQQEDNQVHQQEDTQVHQQKANTQGYHQELQIQQKDEYVQTTEQETYATQGEEDHTQATYTTTEYVTTEGSVKGQGALEGYPGSHGRSE